jgi:phosphoribosyl-ATP pyrophosphohydrolase
MGYHKREVKKGVLGEYSKIQEEIQELDDAQEQGSKVLIICELCDLVGSIEAYVENKFNLSLQDLVDMMNKTKSSFIEGKR